jgi:hypothetical protein
LQRLLEFMLFVVIMTLGLAIPVGLYWLADRPNGVSQKACEHALAVSEYRFGHHGLECVETTNGSWCFRDIRDWPNEIHC